MLSWKTLHWEACDYDEIMHNTFIHDKMQSLEFANWEEWRLQKKEEQILNLQFTHFITVSLKTHLYGAENKNTSDSQKPSWEGRWLAWLFIPSSETMKRDSTHKTNSHNVKAHVVVTDDYGEGLALYFTLCTVYSGTSEERTLWERHFCPFFGGCPSLGGSWNISILLLYNILGWNISNVVKFGQQLVCKVVM